MNRIDTLFNTKRKGILSIFFTAGYPSLKETTNILLALQENGVDMVEIGMPFSDPVADGPVIQESSKKALEEGMDLQLLLDQLETVKEKIKIPVVLMGYLNPVLQYGYEKFCMKAAQVGVDGLILPDLPPEQFVETYQGISNQYGLKNIHLITPLTTDERARYIDAVSNGFLYLVSAPSVTGGNLQEDKAADEYLQRIKNLNLENPGMVGFGISKPEHLKWISQYASGVIIGSAFIKVLKDSGTISKTVSEFIKPFISDH